MKNLKEPIDSGKGQLERYEGETTFPSDLVTFGPVRGHRGHGGQGRTLPFAQKALCDSLCVSDRHL